MCAGSQKCERAGAERAHIAEGHRRAKKSCPLETMSEWSNVSSSRSQQYVRLSPNRCREKGGRRSIPPKGLPRKAKRPGHRLRAQFQSSNFGTRIRVAESRQHKNDNDLIFSGRHRVCAGICVTLRVSFGLSSQSRIPNARTSVLSATRRLPRSQAGHSVVSSSTQTTR